MKAQGVRPGWQWCWAFCMTPVLRVACISFVLTLGLIADGRNLLSHSSSKDKPSPCSASPAVGALLGWADGCRGRVCHILPLVKPKRIPHVPLSASYTGHCTAPSCWEFSSEKGLCSPRAPVFAVRARHTASMRSWSGSHPSQQPGPGSHSSLPHQRDWGENQKGKR